MYDVFNSSFVSFKILGAKAIALLPCIFILKGINSYKHNTVNYFHVFGVSHFKFKTISPAIENACLMVNITYINTLWVYHPKNILFIMKVYIILILLIKYLSFCCWPHLDFLFSSFTSLKEIEDYSSFFLTFQYLITFYQKIFFYLASTYTLVVQTSIVHYQPYMFSLVKF